MKVIYYREDIGQSLKEITSFNEKGIELDYRGPIITEDKEVERISWWRNIFGKRKRLALGGIPIEGLPEILTWGITIVEHIANLLIDAAIVYKFYEEINKRSSKKDIIEKGESSSEIKEKRILQIVTDDHSAESGESDPHDKTILFIFETGLTEQDFLSGYKLIPKIRTKIREILEVASMEKVKKIKCVFSGNAWDIEFTND